MANNNDKKKPSHRKNDELRGHYDVRVIYKQHSDVVTEGDFNEVMTMDEAKKKADELELDLIEMNPKAKPPILWIYDYTKLIWEEKQREKKNKAKAKGGVVKEVQLSTNISPNDLLTKVNHAKEFISKGNKVKVVLTMRGRELSRREMSQQSFRDFMVLMSEVASVDQAQREEGNRTIAVLRPKK